MYDEGLEIKMKKMLGMKERFCRKIEMRQTSRNLSREKGK